MKKRIFTLLTIMLIGVIFLSGCNQGNDNSADEQHMNSFERLNLFEAEHPELDFGISQHDGQRTIRDFAITDAGNLLLLELSDKVYEYSPKGELLETYDFGFDEKGLTAYMLTCDNRENFYFVDGYNSLIIKADKNRILNTASLGEKSIITDPGLIKSISALEENLLMVEAISPEDYITYTYKWDVSDDYAVCVAEPQAGMSLGGGLSYKNELIRDAEEKLTDGVAVTIYENGIENSKFEVHTTDGFILGLRIYGVTQSGEYFANIYEILADGNTPRETLVTIDKQGKVKSIYEGSFKSDDIIRGYDGGTLVLRFNPDGIAVSPLLDLFSASQSENWFR